MADTIFYGGDIITVESKNWEAEAVAVKDGKITAVGSQDYVFENHKLMSTKMINLSGNTMLPGFIEPHTHSDVNSTNSMHALDISGFEEMHQVTPEETWQKIRDHVKKTPAGEWIVVTGYSPILVPGIQAPTIQFLDGITKDHPLLIIAQTYHGSYFNSKVAEICNITPDTKGKGEGIFVKDSNGQLTGQATEITPIFFMVRHAPYFTDTSCLAKAYARILNSYAKHGVTTFGNAGALSTTPWYREFIQNIIRDPDCPVRFVDYMSGPISNPEEKKGVPGKDNFCTMGVKFWVDGSPYTGTMATSEPYLQTDVTKQFDRENPNYGELNYSNEDLFQAMYPYHIKGFQILAHAHGERALDQTLGVYKQLLQEHPRQDHRHRLEHCGLITEAQIDEALSLGVCLTFYPDHIFFFGNCLRDHILGNERAIRFMPMRLAIDKGHRVSAHADSPCTPLGLMRMLKTMTTRKIKTTRPGNSPDDIIGPEQAISIDEGIRAITIDAAYQLHHDNCLGSIEVGKIADFTVLSKNPRNIDPYTLNDIKIISTYKSGRLVLMIDEDKAGLYVP